MTGLDLGRAIERGETNYATAISAQNISHLSISARINLELQMHELPVTERKHAFHRQFAMETQWVLRILGSKSHSALAVVLGL